MLAGTQERICQSGLKSSVSEPLAPLLHKVVPKSVLLLHRSIIMETAMIKSLILGLVLSTVTNVATAGQSRSHSPVLSLARDFRPVQNGQLSEYLQEGVSERLLTCYSNFVPFRETPYDIIVTTRTKFNGKLNVYVLDSIQAFGDTVITSNPNIHNLIEWAKGSVLTIRQGHFGPVHSPIEGEIAQFKKPAGFLNHGEFRVEITFSKTSRGREKMQLTMRYEGFGGEIYSYCGE